MSSTPLSDAIKAQRSAGKTLAGSVAVIIGIYVVFLLPIVLLSDHEKMFTGLFLFCMYALCITTPTLLAAMAQYILRPGWFALIIRWAGGLYLFFAPFAISLIAAGLFIFQF